MFPPAWIFPNAFKIVIAFAEPVAASIDLSILVTKTISLNYCKILLSFSIFFSNKLKNSTSFVNSLLWIRI